MVFVSYYIFYFLVYFNMHQQQQQYSLILTNLSGIHSCDVLDETILVIKYALNVHAISSEVLITSTSHEEKK